MQPKNIDLVQSRNKPCLKSDDYVITFVINFCPFGNGGLLSAILGNNFLFTIDYNSLLCTISRKFKSISNFLANNIKNQKHLIII